MLHPPPSAAVRRLTTALDGLAGARLRVTLSTRRWGPDGAQIGRARRLEVSLDRDGDGGGRLEDATPETLVRSALSALTHRAVTVEDLSRPSDTTRTLRVLVDASMSSAGAYENLLALVTLDGSGALRRVAFSPFVHGSGRAVARWTRLDVEPGRRS